VGTGPGQGAAAGHRQDRQHADAAAIGDNGKPPAGKRRDPAKRFGCGEQFFEVQHPQQPTATERSGVHGIRARKCAGVGFCSLGTLGMPAGFPSFSAPADRNAAPTNCLWR